MSLTTRPSFVLGVLLASTVTGIVYKGHPKDGAEEGDKAAPAEGEAVDIFDEGESLRGELAQPGRSPREVVDQYMSAMKDNDSEDLVGLLGKMVKVVKHDDEGGQHEMLGDEVESAIWSKSSSSHRLQDGKNYRIDQERIDDQEVTDNTVTVHQNVKKGRGWADATTTFTIGLDGLIESIETWLKKGHKSAKKWTDGDGVEHTVKIPAQSYLPA
jgi:hypothetical protein